MKRCMKILEFLVFVSISVMVLYRIRFGIANSDESFYLAIPFRMCIGDCFIQHDWTQPQLSGFLTLPLMKLFLTTHQGLEGLALYFRNCFFTFWLVSTICVWFNLRFISRLGSWISAVILMLYVPYGINALSYNSMGLMFSLLACSFIIRSGADINWTRYAISGFCFACAVLCCPYLVLLFIFAMLIMFLISLRHHKSILPVSNFISFISGASILTIAFILYIGIFGDFDKILKAIPEILSDPSHPSRSLYSIIYGYLHATILGSCQHGWKFTFVWLILTLVCAFDKRRRQNLGYYLAACCIFGAANILLYDVVRPYINFIGFPLIYASVILLLLIENVRTKVAVAVLFFYGFTYGFLLSITSNQGFYVISSASYILTVGVVLCLSEFVQRVSATQCVRKLVMPSYMLLVIILVASVGYLRVKKVFWDDDIEFQKIRIKEGFCKDLYAAQDKYDAYVGYMNLLASLDWDFKSILIYPSVPEQYLIFAKRIASYTSWIPDESLTVFPSKYSRYVAANRDMYPDLALVDCSHESSKRLVAILESAGYVKSDTIDRYTCYTSKAVRNDLR